MALFIGVRRAPWGASHRLELRGDQLFLPIAAALFLEHLLLLFIQCLESRCQSRCFLLRVVLVLLVVGLEFGKKFRIVGRTTEIPHRSGGAEQGNEVVEVESRAVLVEHEEEHHGHQEHGVLKYFHIGGLVGRSSHRVALLAHRHEAIQQIGEAEEHAEEREVVAQSPDIGAPRDQIVVSREVISPKEALLTQLNGIRYEIEHRNPDWHLNQHGQTAAERTGTILRIEGHRLLLALQGVLFVRILRIDGFYLRAKYTRFRGAEELFFVGT